MGANNQKQITHNEKGPQDMQAKNQSLESLTEKMEAIERKVDDLAEMKHTMDLIFN